MPFPASSFSWQKKFSSDSSPFLSPNIIGKLKLFGGTEMVKKQKNENFELSHTAEKCKRGNLWALSKSIQLQNIKKLKG